MFQWRVILLATLAVALLLGGLIALILPDQYEGPPVFEINDQHTIQAADVLAGFLLILGCAVAWSAGALWQREIYAA
jgi:drug/metabolite transporter (DMT)-like permease